MQVKWKPGTKVRQIESGKQYTVVRRCSGVVRRRSGFENTCYELIADSDGCGNHVRQDDLIEVSPASSTESDDHSDLATLVKQANEGLAAYQELKRNHSQYVELRLNEGSWKPFNSNSNKTVRMTVRIKPKATTPVFPSFKVGLIGQWTVDAKIDEQVVGKVTCSIGCQTFGLRSLIDQLDKLLNENKGRTEDFCATRAGLHHPASGETLDWLDADCVLNAIKAYEQKLKEFVK